MTSSEQEPHQKTVLVVDDEPDILELVNDVLTRAGYRVITSPSGEHCLARLERGEAPDLILLDIMMQGLDGWETLRAIKSNPSYVSIPVSMLTVKPLTLADMKREGIERIDNYILKPFSVDSLVAKVNEMFGLDQHIQKVKDELAGKGHLDAAVEYEEHARIIMRHQKLSRVLKTCNPSASPAQAQKLKEVIEIENLLIRLNKEKLLHLEKKFGIVGPGTLKNEDNNMLYA